MNNTRDLTEAMIKEVTRKEEQFEAMKLIIVRLYEEVGELKARVLELEAKDIDNHTEMVIGYKVEEEVE